MKPLAKAFEFFSGMYDSSAGALRSGFFPVQVPGMAVAPVNAARTSTGSSVTPKSSMELSAYWSCVWLIADTISTLPFQLFQRDGSNAWGEEFLDSPVLAVISRRPNSLMTACDYWQFMIASLLLWGNSYSEIVRDAKGNAVALLPLLPQFMLPYKNETGQVRYKYVPTGQLNEPQEDFSSDQIFHLRDRSLDGLVGITRTEFARNSLGIAKAGEQATADTYRNGMRSSGFLMYDKVLKKEQRDQIKASLNTFKTGGADSQGFMVLEAGMSFEALNMTPQDVALLSARQFSVEDICRWFGVPPVLIGHAAAGVTSWGTGIEQLLLGFQSLTLRPYIRRIESAIVRALVPTLQQPQVYCTIDTDDLLGADSTARSALYSTYAQNGIMTRNEIRAAENRKPLIGGDQLTVQSNLVPIEKLGETPPTPTPPPEAKPPPSKQAAKDAITDARLKLVEDRLHQTETRTAS